MSFFSLDSKFSQIMGRVFDLMMLNIIFLIMCIPIVTIGANFTAMYYVTLFRSIDLSALPAQARTPERHRRHGHFRVLYAGKYHD